MVIDGEEEQKSGSVVLLYSASHCASTMGVAVEFVCIGTA